MCKKIISVRKPWSLASGAATLQGIKIIITQSRGFFHRVFLNVKFHQKLTFFLQHKDTKFSILNFVLTSVTYVLNFSTSSLGRPTLICCSGPPPPPLIFQIWGGKVGFLLGAKVGFYRPCRDFAQDYSTAARRVMFTGRIQLYLTCIVPVLNDSWSYFNPYFLPSPYCMQGLFTRHYHHSMYTNTVKCNTQ